MTNIKVGDRVVDRTTGKKGVVDSFIHPISFGYRNIVYALVRIDKNNTIKVEPHNLSLEEGYEKEDFDPIGINNQKNPNDKIEELTPMTPKKKGRKKKDAMDDIVESASV